MNINRIHALVYSRVARGGLLSVIFRLHWRIVRIICHCDIPSRIDLTGVYLCYNGFGIVINPESKIGSGTVIQHSVTIGEMDGSRKCPVIGKNVFVGARAMVLGDIKVGDNVKIGAGAVVIKDVPDNCTVVGVPTRIVE